MSDSAIVVGQSVVVDNLAPDQPSFVGFTAHGHSLTVEVQLPRRDQNGEPIENLTELRVAVAPFSLGLNPFEGFTAWADVLSVPGVIVSIVAVTVGQAGEIIPVQFDGLAYGTYGVAAVCSD